LGNSLPFSVYVGKRLVRIRIYGIIGFSGFYQRVFDWRALVRMRLGGFQVMVKSASRARVKS